MNRSCAEVQSGLATLTEEARRDLSQLGYPAARWLTSTGHDDQTVDDVAIIGGGQSGVTIAAQLKWDGVDRVSVLDAAAPGQEGPWKTFARMEELRTPKTTIGTEFNVPNLSVRRWFETRYGAEAWETMARIPRTDWKDYLDWYAQVFEIRISNGVEVVDIAPDGDFIALTLLEKGKVSRKLARTVVLATGMDGAGGWHVPSFISDHLAPSRYNHTNGPVDFAALNGKRIGILGHGASAFDNAIKALEAGAASVDLCFRRSRLPRTNPHRALENPALMTHFPDLSDLTRWQIARYFVKNDQPPPVRSFETALAMPGFTLRPATPWLSVTEQSESVRVETPHGALEFDHLLLATGLAVNLSKRRELSKMADRVRLWSDCFKPPEGEDDARLAQLPYLDRHSAFLPKNRADAWVQRIFAFNSASAVSHGPHSTSISGHRHALPRLVRGVERRLLLDTEMALLPALVGYKSQDLPVADDFEDSFVTTNFETPQRSVRMS